MVGRKERRGDPPGKGDERAHTACFWLLLLLLHSEARVPPQRHGTETLSVHRPPPKGPPALAPPMSHGFPCKTRAGEVKNGGCEVFELTLASQSSWLQGFLGRVIAPFWRFRRRKF